MPAEETPTSPSAASAEAEGDGDTEAVEAELDDDAVVGEVADDVGEVEVGESLGGSVAARGDDRERSLGRYDPFAAYISEIQRHKLLSAEEQQELAERYQKTGDVNAAARLVTSNLRLVVKISYEYRRAYRNLMDLIQEGNIGLMQAVKRYDPYRGVKLSSYAAWWIRAYILRFILNNWRLVKLGTTQAQRKLFFNLNKEKQRLLTMGIDPTSSELAARLDVNEQEVIEMDRRLSGNDVSLDAPVGESDGKPTSRLELLPSGDASVDDALAGAELGDMVRSRLDAFEKTLTGKDVTIFRERIVADEPVTLQEIGDRYGISRERVRQLEKRLQDKLKAFLTSELGEAIQFG
ncbi:MAG: RNA polymerase factor sigma-32 [Myxococcales bacterium]|nr:RNA polymerase factor sigma-32 [Myxococcales bacterium]